MGEKLVSDKVPATAGNLGRSRNDGPADLPMGGSKARSREPTILGVAVPEQTEAAVAPVVVPPPLSEKTVLGVGMKGLSAGPHPQARETSLQEPPPEGWDLSQPEHQHEQPSPPEPPQASAKVATYLEEYAPKRVPPPATDPSVPIDLSVLKVHSEPSLVPAGLPRSRGTLWWILLLVLAAAVAVGYVRRDQVRPLLIARWHQVMERAKSHW